MKLFATFFLFFAFSAYADQSDPMAPVARFLSQYVKTVNSQFYLWNWFNGTRRNPIWKSAISSDSQTGYNYAQRESRKYFDGLCPLDEKSLPQNCPGADSEPVFGASGMLGAGFYFALDPVITANYGDDEGWVMVQLHVPKGFQYLDVRSPEDQSGSVASDVILALQQTKCRSFDSAMTAGEFIKQFTHAQETEVSCRLAIRHVLRDLIKIDGIIYGFTAIEFRECSHRSFTQGAFVLTDAKLITPDMVRVFDSQTPDGRNDRLRITSLFYKAGVDATDIYNQYRYGLMKYDQYPGYNFMAWQVDENKKGLIMLCPHQANGGPIATNNCVKIPAPSLPPVTYPNQIDELPLSAKQYFSRPLWADLQGQPTTTDLGEWVSQNLFECGGN